MKLRGLNLALMGILFILIAVDSVNACTNFKLSNSDTVLLGNSEDQSLTITEVYITFIPADTIRNYGAVHVGYDNIVASKIQGGMNDQGLAYDSTYVPPLKLNSHLERPEYQRTMGEIFLETCANISDVVDTINQHQVYQEIDDTQWFFVDKSGESLTVSPGDNGELVFTRNSKNYQAVSNHNIAVPSQPDEGSGKERQKIAETMLAKASKSNDVSIDTAVQVLNSIHQEGADINTIYSNIFDVTNLDIYLYYFHQFDDVVKLNLIEELGRGGYSKRIPDFFPEENVEKAFDEYNEYTRTYPYDLMLFLLTVFIDVLLVIVVLYKIIIRIKGRSKGIRSLDRNPNLVKSFRNYTLISLIWIWNLLVPSMIYKNARWQWPPKVFRYPIFEHHFLFIFLASLGPVIFFKSKLMERSNTSELKSHIGFVLKTALLIDFLAIVLTQFNSIPSFYKYIAVTFPLSAFMLLLSDWLKLNFQRFSSSITNALVIMAIWIVWYLPFYFTTGVGALLVPLLLCLIVKLLVYRLLFTKFRLIK